MSKCCYDVITLWCCFVGLRSSWDFEYSCCLCSYETNTLGSPMVLSSSIGLSTSFSTCELGLTIPNVSDGVCCLFFRNYVPRESKDFFNIDINVLFKTLVLEIKHIFILFI